MNLKSFIDRWKTAQASLAALGFERSRRALGSLGLAFFASIYGLLALIVPEPNLRPMLAGLAAVYLVGFLGVVADWFWARWYASGLGWAGVMVGIMSIVNVGFLPPLLVYVAVHGLTVACLAGPKMAALYELQPAWRERWHLDEHAVTKLGRTIKRSAGSLPALVVWALGPREGQSALFTHALAFGVLALAVAGSASLLRLRTLGWFALSAAAIAALFVPRVLASVVAPLGASAGALESMLSFAAPVFLLAALVPFAAPVVRYVRARG